MINFEHSNKKYRLLTTWEEITLAQAIAVLEVYSEFPDNLKLLYKASEKNDQEEIERLEAALSDKEQFKIIPALYAKIICILSDVPEKDIKYWHQDDIRALFTEYCLWKVHGLVLMPIDFKVQRIQSFTHNGETYYFPESRIILDNEKPFSNVTALEFTEVADLELAAKDLKAGRMEVAANIVSILCRPLGEEYDEETCLQRAEAFKTLPMSVIWEVFFYILEPLTLSTQRAQISLMEGIIKAAKQQKAAD